MDEPTESVKTTKTKKVAKTAEPVVVEKTTVVSHVRDNPWIMSTVVLGILLVLSVIVIANTAGGTTNANAISEKAASDKVIAFLNSKTQEPVTLDSISQEDGLYKLMVTYQGNSIPLYTTLSGTYIVSDLIPLDGSDTPIPTDIGGTPGTPVVVDISGAPVEGKANAPVTIVEFSDFECPFCERFYTETLSQIRTNYIDTGKVKLVYMDFPLSFHPQAQKAAESAECVREQKGDDGYYKMHDLLFENQAILSVDNEKKWAATLGVNTAKFNDCLDSGKFADAVAKEAAYGASLGVTGTPGFFVNGISVTGAQPYSVFKQLIDAELAK